MEYFILFMVFLKYKDKEKAFIMAFWKKDLVSSWQGPKLNKWSFV